MKDSAQAVLPTSLPEADAQAIREQMWRLVSSPQFRSSKRYPDFLRYTVEHALSGEIENIKERVLGVEVFGRHPDYDTSADPVVRMTAAEVRKRLDHYYALSGHEKELRIDFPRGSYVPEFIWPSPAITANLVREPVTSIQAVAVEVAKPKRWRKFVAVTAICALIGVFLWWTLSPRQNAYERFWEPIFASRSPVLLCIPDLSTFSFKSAPEKSGVPADPYQSIRETVAELVAKTSKGWQRDEVSFVDSYTAMKVSGALIKRAGAYRLIRTEDATLDDLKQAPAVLIGGTNNPWITQVTSELRFALAKEGDLDYISDRQNPSSRQWGVRWQGQQVDYAIISRVFNPITGQVVVIASGVHRMGTEAAGECFDDAKCFDQAEKLAPGDWQHTNIQIILKTKLVDGAPGRPEVIAAYLFRR